MSYMMVHAITVHVLRLQGYTDSTKYKGICRPSESVIVAVYITN